MNHIDLDLYCCKFYNNDIEIKHTYFLLIPTNKDDTTFRIIFDLNVNPSAETVKHWANQPQFPHCVVEKFHMVQTISKIPENNHNPFERNWTKWLQWQGVTRKKSAKKSKNLSKNWEMNTFILKNSMKIKSLNFIYNSWIKNTTSIPFLNSSKAIIILPGTKPFIPDSETCVLKMIKNSFFFFLSYFTFLTFMIFFLEIFYSTWDIKLYTEITKNYDMVTITKKFFISFFCHVLLIKNPKKYIYSHFTRAKPTPALTTTGKKLWLYFMELLNKIIKWIKKNLKSDKTFAQPSARTESNHVREENNLIKGLI